VFARNVSGYNVSITNLSAINSSFADVFARNVSGYNVSITNLSAINSSFADVFARNVSGYNVSISNLSVLNSSFGFIYARNVSVENTITAQTFNSLSDFKLKENIIYLTEEFNINHLKPCQFNFINNSVTKIGFIAHEVQEVIPLSVTGTKETIQTVDYSAITAATIITIKKLLERVEYLENVLKKHNLNLDSEPLSLSRI